jgi:hypothetical protein
MRPIDATAQPLESVKVGERVAITLQGQGQPIEGLGREDVDRGELVYRIRVGICVRHKLP